MHYCIVILLQVLQMIKYSCIICMQCVTPGQPNTSFDPCSIKLKFFTVCLYIHYFCFKTKTFSHFYTTRQAIYIPSLIIMKRTALFMGSVKSLHTPALRCLLMLVKKDYAAFCDNIKCDFCVYIFLINLSVHCCVVYEDRCGIFLTL